MDQSTGSSISTGSDGTSSDGVQISPTAPATAVLDVNKCIICQETSKQQCTSSDHGRKRVREAADVREDHVLKRLKTLEDDVPFVYHVSNACYKSYTHKLNLDNILKKQHASTSANDSVADSRCAPRCARSKSTPRAGPSPKLDKTILCSMWVCKTQKCL